jgi:diadenosine tetraphosphate (Ap4A) HIT family hydrolase
MITKIYLLKFYVGIYHVKKSMKMNMSYHFGISETSGGKGYRLISNAGSEAHQTVAHFHIHLLAGRNLGPMLVSIK